MIAEPPSFPLPQERDVSQRRTPVHRTYRFRSVQIICTPLHLGLWLYHQLIQSPTRSREGGGAAHGETGFDFLRIKAFGGETKAIGNLMVRAGLFNMPLHELSDVDRRIAVLAAIHRDGDFAFVVLD